MRIYMELCWKDGGEYDENKSRLLYIKLMEIERREVVTMSKIFDRIDRRHQEAILTIQELGLPVDLLKLSKRLKLTIKSTPWSTNTSQDDGYIQYTPETRSNLKYTSEMTYTNSHRKFTIAHLIAHFILHENCIKLKGSLDKGTQNNFIDPKDTEANLLAADILMPMKLIYNTLLKHNIKSIALNDLANIIGVSEHILRIRLNMPAKESKNHE